MRDDSGGWGVTIGFTVYCGAVLVISAIPDTSIAELKRADYQYSYSILCASKKKAVRDTPPPLVNRLSALEDYFASNFNSAAIDSGENGIRLRWVATVVVEEGVSE